MTRRTLIGALSVAPLSAQSPGAVYAYIGCYTTPQRSARGDGIHVYRVDMASGRWEHVQRVGDLVNPSFLVMAADQRHLYSVHGDQTYATAFSVDAGTGLLSIVNRAGTGGTNGVHPALDPSGRYLIAANYGSGQVAVLPIRPDGGLLDATQVVSLPGQPGPHRIEQTASHPHHVVFDPGGRFVLVPDKGLDRIFIFRFDAASGKLTPTEQGSVAARAGSGPRHAAFHPHLPVVWVLNEIASTVATYFWDGDRGSLRAVQIQSTIPTEFTGENTAAEIAVSEGGGFVYCSNRGHDSVACFRSDPRTGSLAANGWTPSLGRTPRFIGFSPSHSFLCVANEQSDSVVIYRANAETGALDVAGSPVQTLSPVCVVFGQGAA